MEVSGGQRLGNTKCIKTCHTEHSCVLLNSGQESWFYDQYGLQINASWEESIWADSSEDWIEWRNLLNKDIIIKSREAGEQMLFWKGRHALRTVLSQLKKKKNQKSKMTTKSWGNFKYNAERKEWGTANETEVTPRKLSLLRREVSVSNKGWRVCWSRSSWGAALTLFNPLLVFLLQHGFRHDATELDTDRSSNFGN